jgi:WD40 repeat protein
LEIGRMSEPIPDPIHQAPADTQMTPKTKRALAQALLQCSSMADRAGRDTVVRDLPAEIRQNTARNDVALHDMLNIISAALNYDKGLASLIDAVRGFEGDSLPMREVDQILAESHRAIPGPPPGVTLGDAIGDSGLSGRSPVVTALIVISLLVLVTALVILVRSLQARTVHPAVSGSTPAITSAVPSPERVAVLTATATTSPSSTSILTAPSPLPTDTAEPTLTTTPAFTPTLMPTSPLTEDLPAPSIIEPDNANKVVEWAFVSVPDGYPIDMSVSPDGRKLAINNGSVLFYDLANLMPMGEISSPDDFIHGMAFAPDWSLVSTMGSNEVRLWDPTSRAEVRALGPVAGFDSIFNETAIVMSGDGGFIAVRATKVLEVLDVSNGNVIKTLVPDGGVDLMGSIALSSDGKTLAASGTLAGENRVLLWSTATWEQAMMNGGGRHLVFSPDGTKLGADSGDSLVVWDVQSGHQLMTAKLQDRTGLGFYGALAFSPDGRLLASGHDNGTIKLWDAGNGRLLTTLAGHADSVKDLIFAPDGTMLASISQDKTVWIWGLPAEKSK